MRPGWKMMTLEEVSIKITDGSHFSPQTSSEGYPYITVSDIKNDTIDFEGCRFVVEEDYRQLVNNGCRPHKGDILFSKDGTVGKVALVDSDIDFVALSSLAIVRPDERLIDPAFLKYVMKSPAFFEEAVGRRTGAAIRRVILRNLRSIPVPVPPLVEQHRIVAILDDTFEGVSRATDCAEKSIKDAHEVFDSFANEMFSNARDGWKRLTLSELCVVDWGNTSLTKSSYVADGEFLAVSAAGCDGRIGHREHARQTPVLSAIGAQCGRMFLPDEDFTAIKNTMTFTPQDGVSSGRFLFWLLQSTKLPKRGAAQPFMSKGDVKAQVVMAPESVSVQESIADELEALSDETSRLESIYRRKREALDAFRRSLLDTAFSGNL